MSESGSEQLNPQLRFGLRACAIGLVLSYAMVFPLKWNGLMPPHLTWLGLTVTPAATFSFLGSMFVGPLWLGRRWLRLFVPVSLLSFTAMLAVIWWERGW